MTTLSQTDRAPSDSLLTAPAPDAARVVVLVDAVRAACALRVRVRAEPAARAAHVEGRAVARDAAEGARAPAGASGAREEELGDDDFANAELLALLASGRPVAE